MLFKQSDQLFFNNKEKDSSSYKHIRHHLFRLIKHKKYMPFFMLITSTLKRKMVKQIIKKKKLLLSKKRSISYFNKFKFKKFSKLKYYYFLNLKNNNIGFFFSNLFLLEKINLLYKNKFENLKFIFPYSDQDFNSMTEFLNNEENEEEEEEMNEDDIQNEISHNTMSQQYQNQSSDLKSFYSKDFRYDKIDPTSFLGIDPEYKVFLLHC